MSNPFDQLTGGQPQMTPQPPGQYPGYDNSGMMNTVNGDPNAMMYGGQPQQHQQQFPPQVHGQQGQQPAYRQPPPTQQPHDPFNTTTAIVPTHQPSNPYAGLVAPSNQSQMVQHTQQNSQWGVPQQQPAYGGDPFSQGHPPPQQYQQQYQQPPPQQHMAPYEQQQHPQKSVSAPEPPETPPPRPGTPPAFREENRTPQEPSPDELATPVGLDARNKYSSALAQTAQPGASPLPRADMVRKTGYVLSRISFRTIVMKKWKQSFWVQYGPHTMLWFRSQSDFDDWLNNPYHSQAQRNFLIKLAVNFAHDLYKPNVRGYQVTQCRTKSYGTKLIRQFKLERWMDYGPTIAAAFGSNNPKEVDDLREALVACMRNTPLNGGIRATGAVRDRPQGDDQHGHYGDDHSGRHSANDHHDDMANRPRAQSYGGMPDLLNDPHDETNSMPPTTAAPAPAEAPDLMDMSAPPTFQQQPQFGALPPGQQYGQPPPAPQGQYPPQGQPQYGQPQYPSAPQQPQYPPQPQQQYGASPQMQQQYPPQQHAYGGY